MENLNASITSAYWCMFHKPPPDAVLKHDETSPQERENDAADMLGAAATFADRFMDANEDPYADVDMFLSDSESSELFSTQQYPKYPKAE
jgi:hypothetical protein